MPDADVPFLDIRELSVGFGGILVLENVSFSTPTASITGLIGPNGAGKTTLMNCISGHVKTRSGSILLGHQQLDLTKKPPRARPKLGVARTYQHSELFEGLTVVDQLMCGAYAIGHHPIFPELLRTPRAIKRDVELRESALDVLRRLHIEQYAWTIVGNLPGAIRQLVDLGRALMCQPRLLLLDEIAAGTTVDERELIVEVVREYQAISQMTVLVIEHDLEFIHDLATDVIVLANGGLLAAGRTAEVLDRPDVLEAYVGVAE